MAVIITDMDMPKSCSECSMFDDRWDYPTCFITRKSSGYNFPILEKRMVFCPLKSTDEMISEIEDYNVRQNFDGRVTMEYMVGVTRGLDLSADIVHKYCDKEQNNEP